MTAPLLLTLPLTLACVVAVGCGATEESIEKQSLAIQGGVEASHSRVGLLRSGVTGGACTATLIRPHHLLTAAHCIVELGEKIEEIGIDWILTLELGGKLYQDFSPPVAIHSDYVKNKGMDPKNTVYVAGDFAIVRLAQDLLEGSVALADRPPSLKQPVVQWGLGLDNEGSVGVSRRTDSDVRELYSTLFLTVADKPEYGMMAPGDSGGPTFDKEGRLIGIHSVILADTDMIAYDGTAPRKATGRETVEMRVDVVRDWMEQAIRELDSLHAAACDSESCTKAAGRHPASGGATSADATGDQQASAGCSVVSTPDSSASSFWILVLLAALGVSSYSRFYYLWGCCVTKLK